MQHDLHKIVNDRLQPEAKVSAGISTYTPQRGHGRADQLQTLICVCVFVCVFARFAADRRAQLHGTLGKARGVAGRQFDGWRGRAAGDGPCGYDKQSTLAGVRQTDRRLRLICAFASMFGTYAV